MGSPGRANDNRRTRRLPRRLPTPRSAASSDVWQDWADKFSRAATSAELAALAEEVLALDDTPEKQMVLQLLCARWAEVDPSGGLAFLTEHLDQHSGGCDLLLAEWALLDLEAAWEAVVSKPADRMQVSRVGQELLRENPRVFWAWLQKARAPSWLFRDQSYAILLELARRSPQEFEAWLAGIAAAPQDDNGEVRFEFKRLYSLLARVRLETDPASVWEWVDSIPKDMRDASLLVILPLLAQPEHAVALRIFDEAAIKPANVSPAAQPRSFYEGTDERNRLRNVAVRFAGLGRDRIVAAIVEQMARYDGVHGGWEGRISRHTHFAVEATKEALRAGLLSPWQAFEFIRTQESEGDAIRRAFLREMWKGLPVSQCADTAAWLRGMEPTEARDQALGGVVRAWARTEPQAAVAFANRLEEAGMRQNLFGELVDLWIEIISKEIGHWLDRRAVAHELEQLLSAIPAADRAAVIREQVRLHDRDRAMEDQSDEPEFEAAVLANALVATPPDEARDGAAKQVFQVWGALDPHAALAWLTPQPDAALRRSALMGTMHGWTKYDDWAASQWLAAQPRGVERDLATRQFVRAVGEVNPESAWTWAAEIGDPATRFDARADVLRHWRDADAPAAQAAVSALTDLTPAEKQKLTDIPADNHRPTNDQ